MKQKSDLSELLRMAGYKVTAPRLAILSFLERVRHPASIKEIARLCSGKGVDPVTVYRTLEAFKSSGIVAEVDLQKGHSLYELIEGRDHHHHIVCNTCGAVEDIDMCVPERFTRSVLDHSKRFSAVSSHSLEFFGVCRECAV